MAGTNTICKAIILQLKIKEKIILGITILKKQAKLNTLFLDKVTHTHTQTTKNKGVINTKFRTVVIWWGDGGDKQTQSK